MADCPCPDPNGYSGPTIADAQAARQAVLSVVLCLGGNPDVVPAAPTAYMCINYDYINTLRNILDLAVEFNNCDVCCEIELRNGEGNFCCFNSTPGDSEVEVLYEENWQVEERNPPNDCDTGSKQWTGWFTVGAGTFQLTSCNDTQVSWQGDLTSKAGRFDSKICYGAVSFATIDTISKTGGWVFSICESAGFPCRSCAFLGWGNSEGVPDIFGYWNADIETGVATCDSWIGDAVDDYNLRCIVWWSVWGDGTHSSPYGWWLHQIAKRITINVVDHGMYCNSGSVLTCNECEYFNWSGYDCIANNGSVLESKSGGVGARINDQGCHIDSVGIWVCVSHFTEIVTASTTILANCCCGTLVGGPF